VRAAAVLLLGGVVGCAGERDAAGGGLSVEWASPDTSIGKAQWSGRAEAAWCEAEHRLAVFAARGDTGAALLVLLPGALAPTDSIPLAASAGSGPVPRATLAVRWANARAVFALTADSGSLSLTGTAPTLAGSFTGTLLVPEADSAAPVVRGRLRDVTVVDGDAGCRLAAVGQSPDSGVP
jgi:hypothetical protein